jgi:hypothetical protein
MPIAPACIPLPVPKIAHIIGIPAILINPLIPVLILRLLQSNNKTILILIKTFQQLIRITYLFDLFVGVGFLSLRGRFGWGLFWLLVYGEGDLTGYWGYVKLAIEETGVG